MANNVGAIGNSLVPFGSHDDASTTANIHNFPTVTAAQYMGITDLAHKNGSEQVYLPKLGGGWRSTTNIISYNPNQTNIPALSPGKAATIAWGRGFGDTTNGWVMYEAGHDIDKAVGTAYVAAQRAFFNFSFLATVDKVPFASAISVPTTMISEVVYPLSVTATSPVGATLTYLWSSSCGGTFSSTTSDSPTFTAPTINAISGCVINCKITDACGRITNASTPVSFFPIKTDPDINATFVNVPVTGNVNTNDDVSVGTNYGTPIPQVGNPPSGVITMNTDGTYTFVSPNIGEYNYLVPVCPAGVSVNCPLELLTITVTSPLIITEEPTAHPDVTITLQNTPISLNVLNNDACNNGLGCTLSNPTITDQPNHGTVIVNFDGTITYSPNPTFIGIDTLYYATCDNQVPSKCDTAEVFITVIPLESPNVTAANDDYETGISGTPVTGNALINDTDVEGNTQTVATQIVTNANGTLLLYPNGDFTFTPVTGFSGPVEYPYTVCDNGSPIACDKATIHILIDPLPFETDPDINATLTNVPVIGNTATNDDVPTGSTYGTPDPQVGDPTGGVITMNPNGIYTFESPNVGKYKYLVPVCPPNTSTNCPLELLTITVTEPFVYDANPTANPDVLTTLENTPKSVFVLPNDACNNGPSCTLSFPVIISQPNHGVAVVNLGQNAFIGSIKYTPDPSFVGLDTLYYATCDNQVPSKCDTTQVFITVIPTGSTNVTVANDDYKIGTAGVPITGNALSNDRDPEGNTQTIASQSVTDANGNFVLNTDGTFTFIPAPGFSGPVEYPYTVCDDGTPIACDTATIHLLINPILVTNPDIDVTYVNVPVVGDVSTNDNTPVGVVYDTPIPLVGNPPGGIITMNPDGVYTFESPNVGVYVYNVPVCPSGVSINCTTEILTITVLDPQIINNPPVANTDIASTTTTTPVTLNTLANDAIGNLTGSLNPASVNITDNPANGTATVNTTTGEITYTANAGFTGLDTLTYQVCDNSLPTPLCATALQIITVYPNDGFNNSASASDDYNKTVGVIPVSGNAIINDVDPEGNTLTIVYQATNKPNEGTLVLNTDGTYTFTASPGFSGPISFPYTVCDNGTPTACADATIHILVSAPPKTNPDINATFVNVSVNGNVTTNDEVPGGTTYGTPFALITNPPAGVISLNSDGSYVFESPNVGVYNYLVPVCAPGQSVSCPTELLTITVTAPNSPINPPTANLDLGTTIAQTPITLNTLANDACNNLPSCGLDPSSVTVLDAPSNGVATVNSLTGEITYQANPGFFGVDTLVYQVCDTSTTPDLCASAYQIITVFDGSGNRIGLNDDYQIVPYNVTAIGNALDNDLDPEDNLITITPQTVIVPNKGTLTLNSNGNYTFVPVFNFVGTADIPYTGCDDGTPSVCAQATIYITVSPQFALGVKELKATNAVITASNDCQVNWFTTDEENTKNFNITRSINGVNFETVGTINASNTTSGRTNYTFQDNIEAIKNASTIFYQIRLNDIDGKQTLSNIISVKTTNSNDEVSIYPIPFTDVITIDYPSTEATEVSITLTDVSGRTIRTMNQEIAQGSNTINLTGLTNIATGTYFLKIINNNTGVIYSQKLTK